MDIMHNTASMADWELRQKHAAFFQTLIESTQTAAISANTASAVCVTLGAASQILKRAAFPGLAGPAGRHHRLVDPVGDLGRQLQSIGGSDRGDLSGRTFGVVSKCRTVSSRELPARFCGQESGACRSTVRPQRHRVRPVSLSAFPPNPVDRRRRMITDADQG